MPLPQDLARFNRYVTNPIARRVAGWAPWFGIITHVGRYSGRVYRTPINIFPVEGGFVIALTYGPDVDWRRNIFAAGECTLRYRRRDIRLVEPRFITTEEGMRHMPALVKAVLRRIGATEFIRLDRA